eukprot:1909299-Pleurochrysis_carterae.AAC.1
MRGTKAAPLSQGRQAVGFQSRHIRSQLHNFSLSDALLLLTAGLCSRQRPCASSQTACEVSNFALTECATVMSSCLNEGSGFSSF